MAASPLQYYDEIYFNAGSSWTLFRKINISERTQMSSLGGTVEKRTKAQVVAAGPSNQSPITITNSTPLCMHIKDTAGEKKIH